VRAWASVNLAHLYVSWDRHTEAEPFLRYLDQHAADLDDPFAKAFWSWWASRVDLWAGRLDVAIRKAEDGRAAAEGQVFARLGGRFNEAHARATKGEYEIARGLLEDALATCERVGDVIFRVRCLNTMGYVYGEIGDLTRAMYWNEKGLEAALAARAPVPEVEMNARLNLAENLLSLGRLDEAAEHFASSSRWSVIPAPARTSCAGATGNASCTTSASTGWPGATRPGRCTWPASAEPGRSGAAAARTSPRPGALRESPSGR
jgi:tetratricopeptide (TPR) repeat protein